MKNYKINFLLFALLIAFAFITNAHSQEAEKATADKDVEILKAPYSCPFDNALCEAKDINYKEPDALGLKSFLDYLFVELQNSSKKNGYIIVYAGKQSTIPETKRLIAKLKSYLINTRGLSAEKIDVIFGGRRNNPSLDIWIVSEDKEPPKPTPTVLPKDVKLKGSVKVSNELLKLLN